jgi:glutamate synthase (NADPH/NADH) large chain
MSLESFIGPEKNLLEETPRHSHKFKVRNPILSDSDVAKIRDISINGFRTKTIYTFFDTASGPDGFVRALERVCSEAEFAIEQGYSFII